MESETFQETMQWLRKKHKKDRAQVRERQNELKELTFRISKRLDGTFSSPVAKKYRPLSMDVGILSSSTRNVIERRSPLKNSASARNSGLLNNSSLGRRSIVNSKRRRRRRNRVTLSQLSLDMSSSTSKILNEFFPITLVKHEDYECDDVIGYLADKYNKNNNEVTIISSDTDFIQCIRENIKLYNPVRKKYLEKTEYCVYR